MRPNEIRGQNYRAYGVVWIMTWLVPVTAQLTLSLAFPESAVFWGPTALFWVVVVAASGCVITSAAVLARAFRRDEAELGYLGLFFLAVSVLPLIHGLTTPGVIFGENQATMSSVQWSIPVALFATAPMLFPKAGQQIFTSRIWRLWAAVAIVSIVGLGGALLIWTDLLPMYEPRTGPAIALGFVSVAGCIGLGRRHLYLACVAGSRLPLIMAAGYGFVGGSAMVWFGAELFSLPFWLAHGLDITGVFAGTIGALIVLRSTGNVRSVVEPILATEPLAALELGLDPIVHRFVADLESCDQITRDHVVRTAELAVKVGIELNLEGRELRKLGLTGLLHDLGKLDIPNSILTKPGRLTDREYDIMKRHAEFGQALVETSPALAEIGILVRCHHERIDGNGYPDGRAGETIPLISRIVAVCDSFDAMANTRQYRNGMGVDKALSILREHAGTQWDADVVAAAERVIRRDPPAEAPSFDGVGRTEPTTTNAAEVSVGCDCLPKQAMLAGKE